MALLQLLKTKIWAIGAAVFAAMLAIIKFQAVRNKSLKRGRDQARADLKFQSKVLEIDEEIDDNTVSRRVQARKEIEAGKLPGNLKQDDWQ